MTWVKNLPSLVLPTFKISWLRDPIARCYSSYYFFHVSRGKKVDTEESRLHYLSNQCADFSYTRLRTNYSKMQPLLERLKSFHFIGTTERLDESMVILRHVLKIDLVDILHINAKMPGEVSKV